MIRVNLLRGAVHRRKKPKKKNTGMLAVLIALPLLAAGGFALWKVWAHYGSSLTALFNRTHQEAAKGPDAVAHEEVLPSSFVSAQAVEDVIRDDVDSLAGDTSITPVSVPYERLTVIEQINYQRLFAKTVVDLFAASVPSGVDFRAMRADSFTTFSAEGISGSREQVARVFSSVKDRGGIIMPKPSTEIVPAGSGYRFTITCRAGFGFDAASPWLITMDSLPAWEDLDGAVAAVASTASTAGLRLAGRPVQVSGEVDGLMRRFHYRIEGSGAYGQFVSFVADLARTKSPTSFSSFSVNALGQGSVRFSADMIVMTRR